MKTNDSGRRRFRLQQKERISRRNLIGNVYYPTPSYRWMDIAISNDLEALKKMKNEISTIKQIGFGEYRIEDTFNLTFL